MPYAIMRFAKRKGGQHPHWKSTMKEKKRSI